MFAALKTIFSHCEYGKCSHTIFFKIVITHFTKHGEPHAQAEVLLFPE